MGEATSGVYPSDYSSYSERALLSKTICAALLFGCTFESLGKEMEL
jgi:hypothetical protein